MCGRLSQHREMEAYWSQLPVHPFVAPPDYQRSYNVPPGTRPLALHRLEGEPQATPLFWGYKPPWYKRGPASNARLDTVLKGSNFWEPLLCRRVIVPADGWYEWTGEKGDKQPWFISARDEKPIYMAGITAWQPGRDVDAGSGFAIVTDDAAGGMVDIHDRRPIVLTPEGAATWIDPDLAVVDALDLLSTPRPEDAFRWWQVTRAMGNSRYQEDDAAKSIQLRS